MGVIYTVVVIEVIENIMNLSMKNRIITMIALATLLWSCDQDVENQRPDFISTEDAKQAMDDMSTGLAQDMAEMASAKGVVAMEYLTGLMDNSSIPGLRSVENPALKPVKEALKSADAVLKPEFLAQGIATDGGSEFEQNWGVYVWDFEKQHFIKTDEAVDYVQIQYPTEGSAENNAVFKLLELKEVEVDGEVVVTDVVAQLYVDDQLELALTIDVGYSFLGFVESADFSLFVAPFELNLDFMMTTSAVAFSSSIIRDETQILSASIAGEFSDSPIPELNSLDVSFSYGSVIMLGSVDVVGMEEATIGADINDYVDFKFYSNQFGIYDESTLIGEVVLMESTSGEPEAYIQFQDGTTELLSEVLAGLFGDAGALFEGV